MAKKTFINRDNPALNFISSVGVEEPTVTERASAPAPDPAESEKTPAGYKLNPKYIEVKSKRVQLVMQPSLYSRVKAAADAAGMSFNEYCHSILDNATREE